MTKPTHRGWLIATTLEKRRGVAFIALITEPSTAHWSLAGMQSHDRSRPAGRSPSITVDGTTTALGFMAATELLSRHQELCSLNCVVGHASSRGAALAVPAELGIGQSVLPAVTEMAALDVRFQVLTAVGVESEARLPVTGIPQLLRLVLDRADRLFPACLDSN